jgi:uncharacterized RDD family membrane protein YckC
MTRPLAMLRVLLLALMAAGAADARAQVPAPAAPAPPPVESPDAVQPPVLEPPPDSPPEPRVPPYWRRPVMRVGGDYMLEAGEEISEAFVLSGNATIAGRVYRDVVVSFGNARIADTAIIDGSLVIVGGSVSIAPGARVDRDFVVVGGAVDASPTFNPGGEHIVVGPEMLGGRIDALVPWVTRGLLWGRPIVPDLPWVWSVVGLFFLVYLALTLVFDRPVRACATTLSRKPLTALLVGLLVLLLAGPVLLLLTVSIIGIAVVPFLVCALLLAWILGKIGVVRWIGMCVLPEAEDGPPLQSRAHAARSFVIGFAVLTVAYMVPVFGVIMWAAVGVTGLGSAVLSFLAGYRKENPAPPPRVLIPRPPAASPVVPPPAPAVPSSAYQATTFEEKPMSEQTPLMNGPLAADAPSFAQVVPNDLLARPHAPFKDRLAAFVLDLIVVILVVELLDIGDGPRVALLLLLAYHVAFWTSKATTVGGIICQLRVVRVTGEPIRFVDALVRGLSAIFSLAAAGLGGLWILKDPDKQAWHDKIAGTYVVKVPRHYPL